MMKLENIAVKQNYSGTADTAPRDYAQHRSGAVTRTAAALALAGTLAGCATYLDVNTRFKEMGNPGKTYTRTCPVGKDVISGFEMAYDVLTPWNLIIDRDYLTKHCGLVNEVVKNGGLDAAARMAFPNNTELATELNEAVNGSYSQVEAQMRVSSALRKMSKEGRTAFKGALEKILKGTESLMNHKEGKYEIAGITAEDREGLHPIPRVMLRRLIDGAIIAVPIAAATGAFNGGGGAVIKGGAGGGNF